MSLIKCPECNKEISDKAESCPSCGYPLNKNSKVQISDLEKYFISIDTQYLNFIKNPDLYNRKLDNILDGIKYQINSLKNYINNFENDEKQKINDRIALVILNMTINSHLYCSWKTYKNFFELVDFSSISENAMLTISRELCNKMSIIEHHSDGSSGNNDHIIFWYPLYKLINHGTNKIKEPIMSILSTEGSFGELKYKEYENLVNQNLNEHNQPIKANNNIQQFNIPKCPTCNSTNIHKISLTQKAVGGAVFGIFSSKIRNTFQCNNCGYKW